MIERASELSTFIPGEILVADTTSPDWGTVMKSATAIVTNRGGRTCHAAIVARELGIPAIVGTDAATRLIRTGDMTAVSCAEGDVGKVYEGPIAFEMESVDLSNSDDSRHASDDESRRSGHRFRTSRRCRTTASALRAWSSSLRNISACIRWRSFTRRGSARANAHRNCATDRQLCKPQRILREALVGRRRHDRSGVLSQACRRALVRLQDQ